MKKINKSTINLCVCMTLLFSAIFLSTMYICSAQEKAATKTLRATITSISETENFIMVNADGKETKIMVTAEFLDDSYIEVGDKLDLTVEETAQGLKLVDYQYILEDFQEGEL